MLDSEELNYFQWSIPPGNSVYLSLYRESELPIMHEWKHQVDISFLTCRPIQRMSLETRIKRFREKAPSVLAIRRITDDAFVGEISIYGYNAKNRSVGVGYFTGPDYRQQGYTKEGLGLLLCHLFEAIELNKVMADTGAFNAGSIALLKSCGFQQDGCLRQHQLLDGILYNQLLFSLLAKEWKSAKSEKY